MKNFEKYQAINEDHKEGKEEQAGFIKEKLADLTAEQCCELFKIVLEHELDELPEDKVEQIYLKVEELTGDEGQSQEDYPGTPEEVVDEEPSLLPPMGEAPELG